MSTKRREAGPPLTLEVIERIDRLLAQLGLSRERLARDSALSLRTVQEWLGTEGRHRASSDNPIRPRMENLSFVAETLGVPVSTLLDGTQSRDNQQTTGLDKLFTIARDVDDELIGITRSLSNSPLRMVRTAYQRILNDSLRQYGMTLEDWIANLESTNTLDSILEGDLVNNDMCIIIADDLSKLTYRLPDKTQILVDNPLLLWDCACETPGNISRTDKCPIHKHAHGDNIKDIFRRGLVEIQWRGVKIKWKNHKELWPPSFDSFSFMLDLENAGVIDTSARSILDIGSGTGFLGIATSKLIKSVERITLSDWLLTPSLYGAINWALNRDARRPSSISIRVGMFADWMIENPGSPIDDIAVCNPPYLPILSGFEEFGVHTVVVTSPRLLYHFVC